MISADPVLRKGLILRHGKQPEELRRIGFRSRLQANAPLVEGSSAMNVIVQISARDKAKAWEILVRHSPGTALPNRTFVVSEDAVKALRKAGIRFTEISRGDISSDIGGVAVGERI